MTKDKTRANTNTPSHVRTPPPPSRMEIGDKVSDSWRETRKNLVKQGIVKKA